MQKILAQKSGTSSFYTMKFLRNPNINVQQNSEPITTLINSKENPNSKTKWSLGNVYKHIIASKRKIMWESDAFGVRFKHQNNQNARQNLPASSARDRTTTDAAENGNAPSIAAIQTRGY